MARSSVSRKDLVRLLADRLGLKLTETAPILDATIDVLTEALTNNERVELRGFGRFLVKSRPARVARNPLTGGSVQVAASKSIQFKASVDLKRTVTQGATVEAASA